MKILALIHRLPCPADRGAKLRAAAELQWLARRHEVWCAGFIDPPGPGESSQTLLSALDDLRSRCRGLCAVPLRPVLAQQRGLWSLATGATVTEGYFSSGGLRRQVLRWSDEVGFDAVLAFSSGMAPLALEVQAKRRVCDFVDLDSRKWAECVDGARWPMSWIYRTEARRLNVREKEWMSRFDASIVCTQREADLLAEQSCSQRLHVIETGASLEVEPLDGRAATEQPVHLPDEPIVGFLGAMDYPPNVEGACWFAESIWPAVQQYRPDARWWIVGRSPSRAVRSLADGRTIRVTGTVPEVEPYLERMRVSIAPLKLARGVQTKVLTAMATGRPCVVTPCVADGIGAEVGRELLVADSPADFAGAVNDLLTDRQRAEAIGTAGREFVQRRYQPAQGLSRLEQLLTGHQPTGRVS